MPVISEPLLLFFRLAMKVVDARKACMLGWEEAHRCAELNTVCPYLTAMMNQAKLAEAAKYYLRSNLILRNKLYVSRYECRVTVT